MAEGHAAVHAARALVAMLALVDVLVELAPVAQAQHGVARGRGLAAELEEAGGLSHHLPPRREASCAFCSKAAISACSGVMPRAFICFCASSTRRKSCGI